MVGRASDQGDRWRLRAAVQKQWLVAFNAVARKQKNLVRCRIEFHSWFQNDEPPGETFAQLCLFMAMGVVDEVSRERWSHACDKRVVWSDRRRGLLIRAAPIRYAVVRPLQLDSVPMNRSRFFELVDDFYFRRLPARQHQRAADRRQSTGRRFL